MDCHGPSALAMTGVWGLGALSRALGSLPRPFNNKGIRHGKAGKTPSLLGLHDAVIQAAPGFSETTKRLPRLSGLPRAFGPRNDGGLGVGRVVAGAGFIAAPVQQQRYSPRQGGENSVIARRVAPWQSRRRLDFLKRQSAFHVCLDCRGPSVLAMTRRRVVAQGDARLRAARPQGAAPTESA
jgi:hypothetical protein